MCHGQELDSSWARAFTGRRFHAILMWWVLCFPDCQLPWLVLSNFAYLSYLELNAWHRPDSWYWHRCADLLRCVRSALLTTPAKPAVTVVVYGKPQAFWCLPLAQPRVIFVYLMMDQDCMPSWEPWANGTNAYSAVVNSEWHKNKVISLTCVRSLCCLWTFFHLTWSHYIDPDWVPQNVVPSHHMLYFMPTMSVVSCWC